MKLIIFFVFTIILCNKQALPQSTLDAKEANYKNYALLYSEIAKKVGQQPIDIIEVVKSKLLYDSEIESENDETQQPVEHYDDDNSSTTSDLIGTTPESAILN